MKNKNITKLFLILAVVLLPVCAISNASATIIVGGVSFDDDAFADNIVSSSFSGGLFNASSIDEALVGSNVNNHIDTLPGDYFQFGFEDNLIFNGEGYDLALFDIGNDSDTVEISLELGGNAITTSNFMSTGYQTPIGLDLRVLYFDLSELGLGIGETLNSIFISTSLASVELTALGALNSVSTVPLPASLLLFIVGLVALGVPKKNNHAINGL